MFELFNNEIIEYVSLLKENIRTCVRIPCFKYM